MIAPSSDVELAGCIVGCISPLALDGGTSFGLYIDEARFEGGFWQWVQDLRRYRDDAERTRLRREGWWVELPTLETGAGQMFGPRPRGQVTVSGAENERITWHCPDRAHVGITRRLNQATGEVGWYVKVQAKAKELYADGIALWVTHWLGVWSQLCGFECWQSAPWRASQVHLNCDFTGLDFSTRDLKNFMGAKSKSFMGVMPDDELQRVDAEEWTSGFYLGRKTSDIEVCFYRKSLQLIEEKRVLPEASMYAPTWSQFGWDGKAPVWRVEFRLRKHALLWDGSEEIDLRSPATLLDRENLKKIWARLCLSRRLVVPQRSRRRRSKVDPRWIEVSAASNCAAPDIKQNRKPVRELTLKERIAKKSGALAKNLLELAGLMGLEIPEGTDELAMVGALARNVGNLFDAAPQAMASFHDSIVPTPLRSSVKAAYSRGKHNRQLATSYEAELAEKLEGKKTSDDG